MDFIKTHYSKEKKKEKIEKYLLYNYFSLILTVKSWENINQ